jgi:hypothetical protein
MGLMAFCGRCHSAVLEGIEVDMSFWSKYRGYFASLAVTLIGALVGAALGTFGSFCVTTWIQNQQHLERRKVLLREFKMEIENNNKFLTVLIKPKDDRILSNNLNPGFTQVMGGDHYEILDDTDLSEKIDTIQFRLNSLEQMVLHYQQLYYNPESHYGDMEKQLLLPLRARISKNAKDLLLEMNIAKDALDSAIRVSGRK